MQEHYSELSIEKKSSTLDEPQSTKGNHYCPFFI